MIKSEENNALNSKSADFFGEIFHLLTEPCYKDTLPLKQIIVRDFLGRDVIAWEEGLIMMPCLDDSFSYFKLYNNEASYSDVLDTIINDPLINTKFTLALPNNHEKDLFYIVNGDADVAGIVRILNTFGYLIIWRGSPTLIGIQSEINFKNAIYRYAISLKSVCKDKSLRGGKDIDITKF